MMISRLVGGWAVMGVAMLAASCASGDDEGGVASPGAGGASAGTSSSATGATSSSGGHAAGNAVTAGTKSYSGSTSTTSGGSSTAGTSSSSGSSSGGKGSAGSAASAGTSSGGSSGDPCAAAGLTWKTGAKTNFESYADPGSEECIEYNGCTWAGQFAFCEDTKPEDWVEDHNLVAVFPANGLEGHDLCVKSGNKTIVVTVVDTCGDSDCDGCCTENLGDADALIDLEKYTNERFGIEDGEVQFADLGVNDSPCD